MAKETLKQIKNFIILCISHGTVLDQNYRTLTIIKFKLKIVLVQEHVLPYNCIFLSFLILSYQLKYNFHSILPKEGSNHSCVFFDKKNT